MIIAVMLWFFREGHFMNILSRIMSRLFIRLQHLTGMMFVWGVEILINRLVIENKLSHKLLLKRIT